MREKLQEIEEDRDVFFGIFQRLGSKGSFKGHIQRTVLLTDIRNINDEPMTDHAWFNYTKGFEDLGQLQPGDKIRFRARIKEYRKGSVRRGIKVEYDYKLSHPSQVTLVHKVKYTPIPPDFFTALQTPLQSSLEDSVSVEPSAPLQPLHALIPVQASIHVPVEDLALLQASIPLPTSSPLQARMICPTRSAREEKHKTRQERPFFPLSKTESCFPVARAPLSLNYLNHNHSAEKFDKKIKQQSITNFLTYDKTQPKLRSELVSKRLKKPGQIKMDMFLAYKNTFL